MAQRPRYERVILKISGESFTREGEYGIDPHELGLIAGEIIAAARGGTQIAVVVGGGNIIRGAGLAKHGQVDKSTADYMGMLATVINGLALREALVGLGVDSRLMTGCFRPYGGRSAVMSGRRGRSLRRLAMFQLPRP